MPSKPRKTQTGTYYITWSNSEKNQKQKVETLRTKKLSEARKRASALDQLERNGYHDPWQQSWFQNQNIKAFVESGTIDFDQLSKHKEIKVLSMVAIDEFINYKTKFAVWNLNTYHIVKNKLKLFEKICPPYINDLTKDHLHLFLHGKTPSYQRGLYKTIKSFINWCVERNYLREAIKYPVVKVQTKIPTFIENDVLFSGCEKYFDQIKKNQIHKIWIICSWLVLRFTGIRPIELHRIKREDVSLEYKRILIGGSFTTKTNRQRFVDIQDEALALFKFILSEKFISVCGENDGYLLRAKNNRSQQIVARVYKRIFENKIYHLKDTYGFWIITKSERKDYGLIYLRDQYGHTSISTTEIYLKYAPKEAPALQDFTKLDYFLSKMINFL
jgi:integrase